MRQRLAPGAEIDAATPDEVEQRIKAALDRHQQTNRRSEKNAVQLDGTGSGTGKFALSRLYDAELERVTVTGAANGLVQIYANNPNSGTDMLEVIQLGALGLYSDSFSNNIWVPAGTQIFVVCSNGTPNGQMTYNIQMQLIRVNS